MEFALLFSVFILFVIGLVLLYVIFILGLVIALAVWRLVGFVFSKTTARGFEVVLPPVGHIESGV